MNNEQCDPSGLEQHTFLTNCFNRTILRSSTESRTGSSVNKGEYFLVRKQLILKLKLPYLPFFFSELTYLLIIFILYLQSLLNEKLGVLL